MKNIIYKSTLFLFAVVGVFFGCEEENEINTNITPVKTFFAPEDNLFVKLEPATNASVVFEWEGAKAEDGTIVFYEVAFDEEGGDFSEPVYMVTSDESGLNTSLTLSHGDLNKIANFAGIESLNTGKIIWTVIASKGTNMLQAEATARTIEVERPAGFAEIPTQLYLTGDATEAGTQLADAIEFKQTASGIFELYTSLGAGTYHLVDAKEDGATAFKVDGQLIRLGEAGVSPAGEPTAYRLRLDFNNAAADIDVIDSVELYFSPTGEYLFDLPYVSNGTWEALNEYVEFKQEGWGRDERYKFRFKVTEADGTSAYEWFGSANLDNPSKPTATTPASFYYMIPDATGAGYDYTFKFAAEVDYSNVDVKVFFNLDVPEYTHSVTVIQ